MSTKYYICEFIDNATARGEYSGGARVDCRLVVNDTGYIGNMDGCGQS